MFPQLQKNSEDPQNLMGSSLGLLATPGPEIDPVLAADVYQAMQSAKVSEENSEREKVTSIVQIWDNLYTRWQPFFASAYKMYRYLRTDQISQSVREMLREDMRPELEFNSLLPLIVYMAGMIAKNKVRMQANPIRKGDEDKSQMHTLLNEWAMNNCDGDYEQAKAAVNAAICGIGWTNNYWDMVADKWITKSTSIFKVMFDLDSASKEDQFDWRYETYHDYFTAEEIISIYGIKGKDAATIRKTASDLEGPYTQRTKPKGMMGRILAGILNFVDPVGRTEANLSEGVDNWADLKNGLYRVVEFHDKRTTIRATLYNPMTREMVEVPDVVMQDEELKKRFVGQQYAGWIQKDDSDTETWLTAVCPRLLPDKPLLEKSYPVQGKGFQFKPTFCYDFDPDPVESKGILHNLISSVDFYNQRMMSFLEWLMKGVNPDVVSEKDAIDPADLPTWQSKLRGKLKEYKKGYTAPAQEKIDTTVGSALSNSADKIFEIQQNLSGFSPNQMGFQQTAQESGTLYNQRVQTGMVMLEHFFSHIQRAQEQIFNYCDRHLQTFITMPRAIRLLGEPPEDMDGVEADPQKKDAYWLMMNYQTIDGVLNDVSEGEYDFKCDPTQLGQTAKQANFLMNMDLLGKLPPDYAFAIAPIIVAGSDSPDAKKMAARMDKIFEMKMGVQDQQTQMALLDGQQKLAAGQKQLTAPSPEEMAQQETQQPQKGEQL
jgi:hypothetical protein